MATPREKLNNLADAQSAFDSGDAEKEIASRNRTIVRTSAVGIVTNVLLAAFKAVIGVMSSSVAIIMDAVNNISDAASSVITIVGTRLAGRDPDKKHPFGYGRIEYLSAMVIALLVLYAGVTSFTESVKKILHPSKPDYSAVALIIVAVAVVVKIILGRYVKKKGIAVNSDSLVNSGEDAILDSVISASTLAAAVIYIVFGLSLEAWLGAVISLVIVKSGIDMLKDTLSQLLGERGDTSLAKDIKATVLEFPEVSGVYDLVLNNYGPDAYNGSLHIEVPDTFTADELDELLRKITVAVYVKNHVLITAIGVYSVNTHDPRAIAIREDVLATVKSVEYVLQMHGFYLNEKEKKIRFDAVISFDAPDRRAVYRQVVEKVQEKYPGYSIEAAMDTDFAES